jgi:maleate isomerase
MVSSGDTTRERIYSMAERIPYGLEGLRGKVGVFCYACMTTTLLKPLGWQEAFKEGTGGVPFIPSGESMVQALNHLDARRIGVFSPYFDDIATLVPGWFDHFELEVAHNVNVPFTPEQVISRRSEDLYPVISREFRGRELDALVILATDLATFTVIDTFEDDLGIPVVSSNLALLWSMLRALGIRDAVGPGRLFHQAATAAT